MSQSSTIAFGLLAGFVVFITVRGELPAYLCVIGLGSNCPPPPATQNAPSGSGSTSTGTTGTTSPSTGGGNPPVITGSFPGAPTPVTPPISCPPGFLPDGFGGCTSVNIGIGNGGSGGGGTDPCIDDPESCGFDGGAGLE